MPFEWNPIFLLKTFRINIINPHYLLHSYAGSGRRAYQDQKAQTLHMVIYNQPIMSLKRQITGDGITFPFLHITCFFIQCRIAAQ